MNRFLALAVAIVVSAKAADSQPIAANVRRVAETLQFLGAPVNVQTAEELDQRAVFIVSINPESRVKTQLGPARPVLQEAGYTPVIVKIFNQSASTPQLRIVSPQAGQVFGGTSELSAERMQRTHLKEPAVKQAMPGRFLDLQMYGAAPMREELSGLEVEYAIALIYSSEAGQREATIGFEVGAGNQDLGFRGEVPVLFDIRPAARVALKISDHDGEPATARLTFRDAAGHVFPPQAKRLAPDFYFQPQIYRAHGETVLLPPGALAMEFSRGPEYKRLRREIRIPDTAKHELSLKLERWIEPMEFGFFSGDHHIHGAGCAHYTSPTEGVRPEDMFLQVSGEGLNVGCVLTWGPCFDFQKQFFAPSVHELSSRNTIMKYDLEISGFGSQALGHVCLLNLREQHYPGSEGTKTKGWPTWTTPVMRWAKEQGGVTGYAHSASGLEINSSAASKRLFAKFDANKDGVLKHDEAKEALLPFAFEAMDRDRDEGLVESELAAAHDRAAEQLPNLAIPEMNSVGAMEIGVTVAMGVCDFISAMDTARIAEWNMWYHLLNCGYALKVSGETDFPCMSGDRVGQGRVYVQLGKGAQLDFGKWCEGLARGRSYVSDGFAHALEFFVEGTAPGEKDVQLARAGKVRVRGKVAFAPETPRTVAQGTLEIAAKKFTGDTVTLHAPRSEEHVTGGTRAIEIVVNGKAVATKEIPADGKIHDVEFEIDVTESSWIALRQFPQLHTNPVNVMVAGKPIRASAASARWVIGTIEQLWRNRERSIKESERDEARATFQKAIEKYREIAAQSAN